METDQSDFSYSVGLTCSEKAIGINPVVKYDLTKNISCNSDITLSTDSKNSASIGFDYSLGKNKSVSVNLVGNFEHTELQDTMVVIGYSYNGYRFRVPI